LALERVLPDDDPDPMDVEVVVLPPNRDEEIASYITELLEHFTVLHWREIVKLVREKYMISSDHLGRILRNLVYSKHVAELPCRFFVLSYVVEHKPIRDIVTLIEKKIRELNLLKCNQPLATPKHPIRFKICRKTRQLILEPSYVY